MDFVNSLRLPLVDRGPVDGIDESCATRITIIRRRRATGHQEVLAKGYVDRVEIICRDETIAVHPRSRQKADFIYNPLHYLAHHAGLPEQVPVEPGAVRGQAVHVVGDHGQAEGSVAGDVLAAGDGGRQSSTVPFLEEVQGEPRSGRWARAANKILNASLS